MKFQKAHGRERCASGKEFGIAEGRFGHEDRALWNEEIRELDLD